MSSRAMILGKDDLLHLQICQKDIIRTDAEVKSQIEDLKRLQEPSTKEVAERNRDVKKKIVLLEEQIAALEKFSNKVRTRGERQELFDQIKEHRNEVERNKQTLRQTLVELKTLMDEQARTALFRKDVSDEKEVELRNRMKKMDNMKKEAFKATESLSSLVSRMGEQVKLSEETTSTLIHSSSVLKGTETEFDSMAAHITSGGKLISKYGRRECTDRILLTIALIVYFAVILYILRKRVLSIIF